ncbi:MAG: single-stranded DNA-binding protein [Deltaproteobacteria bacterium]|jgi:single-strand DNA-binding protein|nr:single-stranded DNA-binding protein [Deltaproteobacteria bacterium]
MLNKVMLIGRLGKDPEIRYAANGTAITNLRIATDESYVDREGNRVERTEWHSIVVFQRQAENCKTYLSKGSLIFVEGSLQTRKWQDQQGQDRYSTEVKANLVKFLDRKNSGQQAPSEEGAVYGGGPQVRQSGRAAPAGEDTGSPFPSEASLMDKMPF